MERRFAPELGDAFGLQCRLGRVGQHGTGGDAVDGDPVLAELDGKELRQADDAPLRLVVAERIELGVLGCLELVGCVDVRGVRRLHDHAPASLPDHRRCGGAGHQPRTVQVHVEHLLQVRQAVVGAIEVAE